LALAVVIVTIVTGLAKVATTIANSRLLLDVKDLLFRQIALTTLLSRAVPSERVVAEPKATLSAIRVVSLLPVRMEEGASKTSRAEAAVVPSVKKRHTSAKFSSASMALSLSTHSVLPTV
jgi:hypothetical protein